MKRAITIQRAVQMQIFIIRSNDTKSNSDKKSKRKEVKIG